MKLLVITNKFPYFYTEAFLEAEYPYLLSKFESVSFLPLYKGPLRESCLGAKVCDAYSLSYSKMYRNLAKVLTSKGLYISLWRHKSKIFQRNRIINTIKQENHYIILKDIVKQYPHLFDKETIVYSYWFNAPVYAMLKIRKEMEKDFKVVCRAHRFDVYDENGEMPNRAFCLREIDKVFPISKDAIDVFTSKYGYKEKFLLSRLGVMDHGRIAKASPLGTFHLVSVSQVHPRKRIWEIFLAAQAFAKETPEIEVVWTHFGNGPQDEELRKWAEGNIQYNFRIEIKGRVPNTEIMKYLGTEPIDAFINVSTSEGVPVSIMEAQSFGIPCIVTNVGGSAEIMNEHNGVLLSASPIQEDIVEAMSKIRTHNFDRQAIKDSWYLMSNAEKNFNEFVNELSCIN